MTYNRQKKILNKELVEGLALDFKTYYKTMIINIVWYWHQNRQIE